MDFVNEGKLDEEIKRRQAEWERVRKKDDPVEAPADVFDNRTLYDKLKEQHEMKKKEFEDSHALKNQIRGVDEDEYEFLNEIDHVRSTRERQMRIEENKEVEEVKKAAQTKTDLNDVPKIKINLPTHKKENKQADLLAHAVVSKRKLSAITSPDLKSTKVASLDSKHLLDEAGEIKRSKETPATGSGTGSNRLVVGILPGLGEYDSDSSSDSDSSDDEDENDHK